MSNSSGSTTSKIVFTPSGLVGSAGSDSTVLDAARSMGVDLDSVCGGRGICGRCTVVPAVGSFPKWGITADGDVLGERNAVEHTYAARRGLADGSRLGCQLKVTADCVIDVPPSSQVHRPVVRKNVNVDGLIVDPMFSLFYIETEQPALGDDRSAVERISDVLAKQHAVAPVSIGFRLLPSLHEATKRGPDEGITVAVTRASANGGWRAVAVWPGFVDNAVGVAIDIGSTTVAGHLCDLRTGEVLSSAGVMNPQIRFGEDLMSRVSYVMMNPGGDRALTAAIRSSLRELIATLLQAAEISTDRVLDVVLVGNPIMHHIALGIDPTPLGSAPFELAVSNAVHAVANDLELDLPNADLYFAPCIAGHVGADTAAAILSEGPHRSGRVQLLVDVGTNAEIVLGNSQRMFAASSPTGPAFEGAQISSGQRATAGAIERVRIDRETFESRVRVIGSDLWSDEEGFSEAIATTPVSGICGSGIIEVIGELYLSGLLRTDGTFDTSLMERTPRLIEDGRTLSYVLYDNGDGSPICVTQNDVRAIQLAKAALRAGIDLLRAHSGFDAIDDVRLAGAFGAHIDPVYALVLGLVPDGPVESVKSSGNSAGSGAVRSLLSARERAEMEATVERVTKIETALEPAFQQLFVEAMGFPHSTAASPHLGTVITLPARSADSSEAGGRRRGRARREASDSALVDADNDRSTQSISTHTASGQTDV
jgi:uncharacterized 2Fe-2S/4Fe-4S cluster protein (DUF4445 family)